MKVLKPLFWDADWSKIDLEKHKTYVIERVLELGDPDAVRWLFSVYSDAEIKSVLETSRNISTKSVNYWTIILKSRQKSSHV